MVNIDILRHAKCGDVIVVKGDLFHREVGRTRDGYLSSTIISVLENDGKCIHFDFALGYDDKNDCTLRCWISDYLYYSEDYIDYFEEISVPTAKQYSVFCKFILDEMRENYVIKSEILRTRKDELFIFYVRNMINYYHIHGSLNGHSKEVSFKGVTKLSAQDFFKYKLDNDEYKDDEYIAHIYEQIKNKGKIV